jgi:heat shock protein HtpX
MPPSLPAAGGHEQLIRSNRRKTVLLVGGDILLLAAAFGAIGYWLGNGGVGAAVGAVIGVVAGFIAALSSPSIALALTGAHKADGSLPQVQAVLDGLVLASGAASPPTLYVVDDPGPNAFAVGTRRKVSAIAVTTGIVPMLSRDEMEGVLAHELSHILDGDTRLMTFAVGTAGLLAVVADITARLGFWSSIADDDDDGPGAIIAIGVTLLAFVGSMAISRSLSRTRESLADANAVDITRNPGGLRKALEKLEANHQVVTHTSQATAHLWIESPLSQNDKRRDWADTHPPIAERIDTLRALEGLPPGQRGPVDPVGTTPGAAFLDGPPPGTPGGPPPGPPPPGPVPPPPAGPTPPPAS